MYSKRSMLSSQALTQIKERLLAEKSRLEGELSTLGKKSSDGSGGFRAAWEEYGNNEEENAAEVTAYTDSLGLSQALDSELNGVNQALLRLEQGTYGVCAGCGKDIAEQRLVARPMSVYCIECQENKER